MPSLFEVPPLQRYLTHQSTDIVAINTAVADFLCPHKINVSGTGTGVSVGDALIHHAPLANGAIMYLVYGTEIRVDISQLGFYLLELPLSGASTTFFGDSKVLSGPGQAVIAGPYRQFATEWTVDCSKLLIKLESSALEGYLSTLLGRRQIRALDFEMEMDLLSTPSAALLRVIQWVVDDLDHPDSLIHTAPMGALQYQRMLMWTLLHCQPNNYSEELAARKLPQMPHYILQTERYIQANYQRPISLEQLVDNANVSERTLLEGFKRYRDVSPMKLLKLTRLNYVHLALKEANAADSNVTDLALTNGFSQLGKFSTEYKERFGESPSETLKA